MGYRKLFSGLNMPIALENGESVIPINFDNAATTPPLKCVNNTLIQNILMYGSVGRGKGQRSEYCTQVYEDTREFMLDFFNVKHRENYSVIYVKNTTEGVNLLAKSLIKNKDEVIITTRMEHHANDLPWRNACKVVYIDVDKNGKLDLNDIEKVLRKNSGRAKYFTITAASNVTGYVNDINKIAKIAHRYGIKIIVDAAQLVAHKKINIGGYEKDDYIDYLVFSGHKIYAPFGSGVVIGLKKDLDSGEELLKGGGAVEVVLDDKVYVEKTPHKYEAGTPNFLGIVAISSAMKSLLATGFENIEKHEKDLRNHLIKGLKTIDRTILYGDESDDERLGVVTFNIEGIGHDIVAKRLADFRGIAVRHGGFCAHPYVRRLLGISKETAYNYAINGIDMPGMVRASFGLYNNEQEVEEFVDTLKKIINRYK